MNTAFMIISLVLCVASAMAFIFLKLTHVGLHGFWGKVVASLIFTISGFVALMLKGNSQPYMFFLLLGLMFGMVGDILLELKVIYRPHDFQYLNGGMLSFGLGHLCYIVAMCLLVGGSKNILTEVFVSLAIGAVLATIITANSRSMGIDFGRSKWQAIAYSFVICIDLAFAVALAIANPLLWIMVGGLAMFLVSDLLLSFIYWGTKNTPLFVGLNLGTYYLAQILIVALLFVL